MTQKKEDNVKTNDKLKYAFLFALLIVACYFGYNKFSVKSPIIEITPPVTKDSVSNKPFVKNSKDSNSVEEQISNPISVYFHEQIRNKFYKFSWNEKNSELEISPDEKSIILNGSPKKNDVFLPFFIADFTNNSNKPVSINALRFYFYEITSKYSNQIVVKYRTPLQMANIENKYKFVGRQQSKLYNDTLTFYYAIVGVKDIEPLIRKISEEQNKYIETIYLDDAGASHSPFEVTDSAHLIIDKTKSAYDISIGHIIKPNETLSIPIKIGSNETINAIGEIDLIYNGTNEQLLAKTFLNLHYFDFLEIKHKK